MFATLLFGLLILFFFFPEKIEQALCHLEATMGGSGHIGFRFK